MKNLILLFSILLLSISLVSAKVEYPSSFFPPLIEEVSIYPEIPSIGEKVRIKAVIFNPPEKSQEEIIEVYLYYSVNEGLSWNKIEMENSEEDNKVWLATIPGQDKEGNIIFYITAIDTGGNIATELPGKVKFQEEEKIDWLPQSNTLSLICEDEDETEVAVPNEFDIRKVYAGIDENYLYLKTIFDGNVPEEKAFLPGQMIPFYQINISNTDKKDEQDKIWGHNYLYYSPAAKIYNMPICAMGIYDARGIISMAEFKKVDYYVDKNELYIRIKRENIRGNPQKRIKIILTSGYPKKLEQLHSTEVLDTTSFIYIYLDHHSYKVIKK